MGQQADTTGCLFFLSRHKRLPLMEIFLIISRRRIKSRVRKRAFPENVAPSAVFAKAAAAEGVSIDFCLAFSGKGLYNGRQKEKVAFLYRP